MQRFLCFSIWLGFTLWQTAPACAHASDPDLRRGLKRDLSTGAQPYVEPDAVSTDIPLELPPLPSAPSNGLSALGTLFTLQAVTFNAPKDLALAALDRVAAAYLKRELATEDLELLRQALAQEVARQGYIGVRVSLPDQDVVGGSVRFDIEITRLQSIEFKNVGRLSRVAVERPFSGLQGSLLRIDRVQDALRELDQDPRIERLDASLEPAADPLNARLVIDLEPARPYSLELLLGNDRPRSSGRERAALRFEHLNLLGHHDELALEFGESEGADDWFAGYRLPLFDSNWSLLTSASKSDVSIIQAPFDRIDIQGVSRQESLGFGWWMRRSLEQSLELGASLDRTRSKGTLLGEPFSFAPGEIDGGSRVVAFRTSLQWEQRADRWARSSYLRLSEGIGALDSTQNSGSLPDSRFTSVFAQAQHLQNFAADYDWTLRAAAQWADRGLLPSEKLALGGSASLRGTEPNVLVRDNGWLLSFEVRRRFELDVAWLQSASIGSFVDFARGWNNDGYGLPSASLGTIGLSAAADGRRGGLRITVGHPAYVGGALENAELEDWRVTVEANFRLL